MTRARRRFLGNPLLSLLQIPVPGWLGFDAGRQTSPFTSATKEQMCGGLAVPGTGDAVGRKTPSLLSQTCKGNSFDKNYYKQIYVITSPRKRGCSEKSQPGAPEQVGGKASSGKRHWVEPTVWGGLQRCRPKDGCVKALGWTSPSNSQSGKESSMTREPGARPRAAQVGRLGRGQAAIQRAAVKSLHFGGPRPGFQF